MASPEELGRYYDDLSEFELSRRSYSMHKEFAHGPTLDDWLHQRVASRNIERLLDIGCGFGTSLARMRSVREGHGLTISPFQKRQAERLHASRRDLKFFVGSYEEKLPGIYDALLSIESLVFATELEPTIQNLCHHLEPGGRVFLVEDMSVSAIPLEWEAPYRDGFRLSAVYRVDDFERVFEQTGLAVEACEDLTAKLALSPGRLLGLRTRLWSGLKRVAPTRRWVNIASAFWGGAFLERMYAEGAFTYRFYELRKVHP